MSLSPKSTYNRRFLGMVGATIAEYRMFDPEDRVLVGVSGGPDSVALLHCLMALDPPYALKLGIFHLNHRLRGDESDNDACFVEKMARELDLPFYYETADVTAFQAAGGHSPEEAARHIRYIKMEETAETAGYRRIALGHQWDDNAELTLMFLIRGSGRRGLSGIPPKRGERFVRPLIRIRRTEIMRFLKENNIPHVEDASNCDTRFLRNKIRRHLIPLLQTDYNPNIKDALNRTASILRDEELWIEERVAPLFHGMTMKIKNGELVLSIDQFKNEHPAIQRRLLRRAIEHIKGDTRRITLRHVDDLLSLFRNGAEQKQLHLPGGINATLLRDRWIFSKQNPTNRQRVTAEGIDIEVSQGMCRRGGVSIPGSGIRFRFSAAVPEKMPDFSIAGQQTAFFDMDRISFPLRIRSVRPGDRFKPLGMKGTQKVSRFLKNNKIPREMREKTLLLTSGGRIIWVAGHRISELAKITRSTCGVLTVQMFLPNHPR